MCGVYFMDEETYEDILEIVKEIDKELYGKKWEKEFHPNDKAPIIKAGSKGLKLGCQRWGYPGVEKKGVIFNARSESVFQKNIFHNGIRYHRAVVPAKEFYEWNLHKEKYTFSRADEKTMYLAGFYDVLENEERFVILTTTANESMKKVHDRMPLILEKEQIKDWVFEDSFTKDILMQESVQLNRSIEFEQISLF